MFLHIADLQQRNLDFDLKIVPGELNLLDDTLDQETVLAAKGVASFRSSTGEILVQGALSVVVSFPCDRCLERVRLPIEKDFDLVYLPEESGPVDVEREIGEADTDVAFYADDGVDLNDILRELIILELPMRRVCVPVCAEVPVALREAVSSATKAKPDSRWDALQQLREMSNAEKS